MKKSDKEELRLNFQLSFYLNLEFVMIEREGRVYSLNKSAQLILVFIQTTVYGY